MWKPGTEETEECGLLTPSCAPGSRPSASCAETKDWLCPQKPPGTEVLPPPPPYLTPALLKGSPAAGLADDLLLTLFPLLAFPSHLPAFPEGETGSEKCHRGVATEVGRGEPRLAP